MLFLYEGTGLSGFQKDGVNYYYLRNGQNDIIGILDASGNRVVSYTYDAWGKLLTTTGSMASTLDAQNPFRYRGYYFDTESGLYYLQSRYYDPNTGRFLNVDGQLNLDACVLGVNLFAYCNNNPTNYFDPDGHRMLQAGGDSYAINGKVFNDNSSKLPTTIVAAAKGEINKKVPPPPSSGYVPPKKNPNPRQVPNPNGSGKGWPAKDGGIWMPDNNMHGGSGWTVQYPGGYHEHHYPDGHVRKTIVNVIPDYSPVVGVVLVGSGVIAGIWLVANDATGIGVADDWMLEPVGSVIIKGGAMIFG